MNDDETHTDAPDGPSVDKVSDTLCPDTLRADGRSQRRLIAVLAVAALAFAILFAVTYIDRGGIQDEADRVDDIADVASEFGVTLYTYNYQKIDEQLALMQELSTPSFSAEYRESFEANLRAQITEREVVSTSELTDVPVSRSEGDQARAIVIVSTSVARSNGATATISALIDVSMLRVDGEWLVDKVLTIANDGTITDADGNTIDPSQPVDPPSPSSVPSVPDQTEQEPADDGE